MSSARSSVESPTRHRPRTIAVIVVLVLTIAAGWFWLRGRLAVEREARLARGALAAGRLEEAAEALERWLRSAPQSGEAHYRKARLAWARNDLATLDRELARARALGYPREPLARLRGLALARTNQASQAEPLLRQAFEASPTADPEVAEALARLYLGTFRLAAAASVLDRWIRDAPDDARPYLLRTEIDSRRAVEPEVLIAGYHAALQRDPNLDQARLGLADQLRAAHRNAEASTEYAAYLARKPADPIGYLGAGQNALEMGDVAEAGRLLDRALALAPRDAVALAARATIELNQGRYEAALDYFDRAVQSDPFDAANRYQRMLLFLRLGKKAQADAELQAVERIRKEQAEFGRISRELHRSPEDPKLRSAAARWLMDHGHEDEAVEWASLVLRADPAHPGMNRLLADHYRKKGQLGLANFYQAQAGPPPDHPATAP